MKPAQKEEHSSFSVLSDAARCQPTTLSHTQPEGASQHEDITSGARYIGGKREGEKETYSQGRQEEKWIRVRGRVDRRTGGWGGGTAV